MARDWSELHELATDLFAWPTDAAGWEPYRLSQDQIDTFHEQGFLAGVKILNDEQIEALKTELAEFFDADHEGQELWYEYHTNESTIPETVISQEFLLSLWWVLFRAGLIFIYIHDKFIQYTEAGR